MITIIHGDDHVRSRQYLQEQKPKENDFKILTSEQLNVENLTQIIHGSGLFSDSKKVFVENFLSKTKPNTKLAKEIVEFVNKNSSNIDIFFWEENLLRKPQISAFTKVSEKIFKLPQNIFLFLDSIKPNNGAQNVLLFHKAIDESEVEQVFFMIIRQFRLLLAIADEKNESIDEVVRLAPWQKGKLFKQSKLFSEKELKNIYNRLYQIDTQMKTGFLPLTLTQSIDFLLLEI